MVVMAVSGLNVAIPSIQRSLGATATDLHWIIDSYAIIFAGLLPAYIQPLLCSDRRQNPFRRNRQIFDANPDGIIYGIGNRRRSRNTPRLPDTFSPERPVLIIGFQHGRHNRHHVFGS